MARTGDARPPRTGLGEKETLVGFLDYLRSSIAAKAEGVPEPQARTPGVPSGTCLLGLVKHLAYVERFYFLGEAVDDWKATFRPTMEETVGGVLGDYRQAIRRANQVIECCTDLAQPAVSASSRSAAQAAGRSASAPPSTGSTTPLM